LLQAGWSGDLVYLIQRFVADWTVWGFDVVDTETCYWLVGLGIDVVDTATSYWLKGLGI